METWCEGSVYCHRFWYIGRDELPVHVFMLHTSADILLNKKHNGLGRN